jgi:hypothetical protein
MPLGLPVGLNDVVVVVGALAAFVLEELAFHAWEGRREGGREGGREGRVSQININ